MSRLTLSSEFLEGLVSQPLGVFFDLYGLDLGNHGCFPLECLSFQALGPLQPAFSTKPAEGRLVENRWYNELHHTEDDDRQPESKERKSEEHLGITSTPSRAV